MIKQPIEYYNCTNLCKLNSGYIPKKRKIRKQPIEYYNCTDLCKLTTEYKKREYKKKQISIPTIIQTDKELKKIKIYDDYIKLYKTLEKTKLEEKEDKIIRTLQKKFREKYLQTFKLQQPPLIKENFISLTLPSINIFLKKTDSKEVIEAKKFLYDQITELYFPKILIKKLINQKVNRIKSFQWLLDKYGLDLQEIEEDIIDYLKNEGWTDLESKIYIYKMRIYDEMQDPEAIKLGIKTIRLNKILVKYNKIKNKKNI